jgi:hypothetical protein
LQIDPADVAGKGRKRACPIGRQRTAGAHDHTVIAATHRGGARGQAVVTAPVPFTLAVTGVAL